MEETYIDRIKAEKAELEQRITELLAFMESDEFAELYATEKWLLRMLYCEMETYITTLASRLSSEGDIKALKAQEDEWRKEGKNDDEIAVMCVERLQAISAIGKEKIAVTKPPMSSGMLNVKN